METTPVKTESLTKNCAKNTGNVETKIVDKKAEYVETNGNNRKTEHVETYSAGSNAVHVETQPSTPSVEMLNVNGITNPVETPDEVTVETAQLKNNSTGLATAPASETNSITTSNIARETGVDQSVADSPCETSKDTSMQNSSDPNPPAHLPNGNEDVDDQQTDAYSDEETIQDINSEFQIPVVNDEIIKTGNDTVVPPTDSTTYPDKTDTHNEATRRSVMLKLQPLSDIDIDIWSTKVGTYHTFKADVTIPTREINITLGKSLRGHKEVDYTPMLTSDQDSEPELGKKP